MVSMMDASRILALAGPHEETGWKTNLRWFRAFVFLQMGLRSFLSLDLDAPPESGISSILPVLRVVMIMVAAMGLVPRFTLWSARIASLLLLLEIAATVPFTANHVFLEFLVLALLGLLDEREQREGELLLQAIRWLVAVVFFYTGLQKVLYGCYFDGQALSYLAGTEDRFRLFFQHLIPAEEMQRLISYNEKLVEPGKFRPALGSGPYRVDSLWFIIVSNGVYIFEMLAGVLLIVRRTRSWAVGASIVFVIMIELGAREITFGALMINLLLLSSKRTWVKWLFVPFAMLYLYLVAAGVGWVPMFEYSPT